ncbi:phage tail sheath family protein [Couchioplanes azureus]|uniref:phage tail sheath family protein n=1 Tax=Couchioplanes caeruleus TaxID=56438 RepID=UPI001670A033|nr:phage tail sheath subtilisin-like domain-containing protein [Couchioplanes caeruleus]GGQ82536.1 tail protein [Couchioplanes caeruleus subsp. azureus]
MPTYLSPGVYVEEVEAGSRPIEGVGTAVAAFVGFAPCGPFHTPTLVTNWGQYTKVFGEFAEDYYLAHAVYGYFLNGGGNCYVVRVGGERTAEGDGATGNGRAKPVPRKAQGMLGGYRLVSREWASGGAKGGAPELSVEVTDSPPSGDGGEAGASDKQTIVVKQDGKPVETHQVTTKRGKDHVVTVLREQSKLITAEEVDSNAGLAKGTVTLRPEAPPPAPARREVAADDYVGDVAERTGFGGLETVDEVTMVAVPDLMSAYRRNGVDLETVKAVQLGVIAHCELMGDRMAILDAPPGLSPQQVREWRTDLAGYDSKYASLYYPWIKVFDPATGTNEFVPPSGHIAGVWARNDAGRGVHKAPANEVVRGAITLATQVTKNEQELLNPVGVNCIRTFPGRGVRVWGARTLSSDPAWRYLNVRRLFNYLEESILAGTQWVVFEPNDDALWARIRRTISAFLVMEWRRGALFGLTPDEAFYVRCDRDTNPAESIDLGQVVCEIGVAPVKPAEFVVFRLAQFSGGTSLVNE